MLDEETEQTERKKNTPTGWSDYDSDYEIIRFKQDLIVTWVPPYMRKHHGGYRTGTHVSQTKIMSELAKVSMMACIAMNRFCAWRVKYTQNYKGNDFWQHVSADSLY